VVVASVSFFSLADLDHFNFLRDVLFYLGGLAAITGIISDRKVYVYESALFLAYYFSYVAVACFVHYCGCRKTTSNVTSINEDENKSLLAKGL